MILRVDRPRPIGLLVGEYGLDCGRIKALPVFAAELVHRLATVEQTVVIPVGRLAGDRRVVLVEAVREQPIAGPLRFFRMMKTGVGERENAGASHRTRPTGATC